MRVRESYRWVMLVLGFSITTLFAVGSQEIPPILEMLIAEIGLSYAQAGSLMTVFSLPGFIVAILWGIAIAKFGTKNSGIISIILFLLGNFLCIFANTYDWLLIGRTIMGVGAQAFPIIGASTCSEWFIGKEVGLAMGVYTSSVPLGSVFALLIYGPLGTVGGWRLPLLVTSLLGMIFLVLFAVFYETAPIVATRTPLTLDSTKTVTLIILPVILAWLFFQGSGGSYTTFASSYFLSIGYPIELASLYASAWMLGSLFLSPFIGRLLDNYGNLVHLIILGGLLIIISFGIIIFLPEFSFFSIVILSLGATLTPVGLLAIMPRLLPPDKSNLGYSLMSSGASIGFAIGPLLSGFLRDVTGNYIASFVAMATFMLLTVLVSLPLYKRIELKRKSPAGVS